MVLIIIFANKTETANNFVKYKPANSDGFSKLPDKQYHKSEEINNNLSGKLMLDELGKMVGIDNIKIGKSSKPFSVAVIDTGIFPHDDLVKPENRIIAFKDFVNEKEVTYDDNGHGTAIAGIIGGNGFMSNSKYKGIAPFVNFVSIKVLDYECKGRASIVAKGIHWAIENKEKYNIKVMNISVGIQQDEKQYDEVAMAAEKAYKEGILVVASVGNIKNEENIDNESTEIFSPAYVEPVLAVGSTQNTKVRKDLQYNVAKSSSHWTTSNGKIKPDLVAPGGNIFSLKSDIYYKGDGYIKSDNTYSFSINGTSASCAVVTGIVSVMLDKFPSKSLEEIKKVLFNNCVKIKNEDYKQGAGFIYLREEYFN